MNVLSLFTGIGGLDLGLQRAGMTIAGQVEIDPWCQTILAKHWPEVPRHDDVRTCAAWWQSEPRPAVDLICGGFPCQPVSVAGKRLAQADERWLWPAFADTIRALRPRYALMENVPGLLASAMGEVLGDLAACGYDAEWDCVSAAAVGAPHLRERVWIVAYAQEPGCEARSGDGVRTQARGQMGAVPPACSYRRSPALADTEGQRGELRPAARQRPGRPAGGGPAMADTSSAARRIWPRRGQQLTEGSGCTRYANWWITEPDVGRVAHGIPRRVDRLRGLGNAVVPQVAEHIGRLIMEAAA